MAVRDVVAGVSYPHLALAIFTLLAARAIYTVIYRLYFHPLSKYPGPFWAKISTWPSYLITAKQDRHVWMLQLQDEYGPVFRYRPDSVVFNTPEGYKAIFGPKGNVKKTESYYRLWPHNADITNTWNVTDISAHARKRRVLNQAFSDRALRGAEPLVHSNVDRWLQLIRQRASQEGRWTPSLNMADEVNYLVFDILGDLCFGRSFDMKEEGSNLRHIPRLMGSFLEMMQPVHLLATRRSHH